MRVSGPSSYLARVLVAVLVLGLFPDAGVAQTATTDYSKPANLFASYSGRDVPEPNFANSTRLEQLVKDGKLRLSLNDAIAIALENNLDLVIARYNLNIADTDVLRVKSGQSVRGVNTGVVANTPGGGTLSVGGGGAGGTSTGGGGAGAGSGGIVLSTVGVGPPIDSFDPQLTSTLSIQHTSAPQANTVVAGVPALLQNTSTVNFGYQQGWATGTLFNLNFNNSRITSNSTRTFLVPQLNSNFIIQLRQHLLQGLSWTSNRRFILLARNNREITDVAFRQQIIFTVTQIENMYWNLVNAYEDVKAKQRAVQLSQELENNNRKQVEIGTLAPIEVINAESQVASAQQNLIVSQTNLELQQVLMRNALSKNQNDPQLASVPIVPTDRMDLPQQEPVTPLQDMINEALQHRPELAIARIDLTTRDITKKAARNALLPTIDLIGNYGGNGLGGVFNPLSGTNPGISNTGWSDAVSNIGSNPSYLVGLSVTIPIRNRAAQADQVRSELEYRQAQVRLQQLQNNIAIDVRNAQYALIQNRARVDAAQKARDFAQQSLVAEQKKFQLGASTTFNVLTALNNLTAAESNLVTAMAAYQQSRVSLDQVTGRTLERLGIDLGDAEQGRVQRMPAVPGVVPRTEPIDAPTPAAPTAQPPKPPSH